MGPQNGKTWTKEKGKELMNKGDQISAEISTALLETGVNRMMDLCFKELKLTPLQAAFILGEAARHVQKVSGIKVNNIEFTPTEKGKT